MRPSRDQGSIPGFTNTVRAVFDDTLIGTDAVNGTTGPTSSSAAALAYDRVRGGSGDDTLFGQAGKGKDFCTGGGGNDFIKTRERPRTFGAGSIL